MPEPEVTKGPRFVTRNCMKKAHPVDITEDMLRINKLGRSCTAQCTTEGCTSPVPISNQEVGYILGLSKEEMPNVIEILRKRMEEKGVTSDNTGTGEVSDETVLEREAGIYKDLPDTQPGARQDLPPPPPPSPLLRRTRPVVVDRQPESQPRGGLMEDDSTEISPRDILTMVIEDSGLPRQEIAQLTEWVSYAPDDNWDPYAAKDLFERFGLSSPNVAKLTNRFRNQLELHRRRLERTNKMVDFVGSRSGGFGGMPGRGSSMGGYTGPGAPGGFQMPGSGQDPCNVAIQAIITGAGGRITPEVLQAIDTVRAAYGQMSAPQGMPTFTGGIMPTPGNVQAAVQQTQMTMMQMFKEMMQATQDQKKSDEDKAKEKAEIQQRFDQLQALILAAKNSTPLPVAQDSENKMILDALLTIVKEKTAAPAVPASQSREDLMFTKMFEMFIETAKGKPAEAMAPLQQEIGDLKDQISRLGGGFAGLPTNTDQLHGIIDYMKATAEIKKTDQEYADKTANRELIMSLAQGAVKSIGEAVATVFIQNPGTPNEAPVTLKEQPIDDGSVVSVQCPVCGALMTAPKDAAAVRCPNCNSVFDRQQQQKSPEETADLVRKQLEQKQGPETPKLPPTAEKPLQQEDLTAVPSVVPVPKPSPTVADESKEKEIGPLSRSIMKSQLAPGVSQPTVAEPLLDAENALSLTGEQTVRETEESG